MGFSLLPKYKKEKDENNDIPPVNREKLVNQIILTTLYEQYPDVVGISSYDYVQEKNCLVTPGIEIITGYSAEKFNRNEFWKKIIHPDDVSSYINEYSNLINGNSINLQYRIIQKNGGIVWIQDRTIPIFNSDGKKIRVDKIISNITEQKEIEEKMNQLAYFDSLTKLPNNIMFNKKINELIEAKRRFTVMYLDLDRFRNINYSLGHEIGNKILQQFSKRMNRLFTNSYQFCRMDGDEFGIILWNYEQDDYPKEFAKKIMDSFQNPFVVEEFELYLTASIGMSEFPTNGSTKDEILKNTTSAVYRAKTNGKNNVHIYSPTTNISSFKQFELEKDLRKSIDNNQLVLHFQPRVDSKTGILVSAEALIRWEHPVWGLVSPGEFIPIAEESGFINEISDWVFQEVCRSIASWKCENLTVVPISINITSQRLLKSDWLTQILKHLSQYDVDPSLIEFEITETTLFLHEKEVEFAIQLLKDLNIKIALDDFGTGYSSLAHINNFTVDTIKIDKSFIEKINKEANAEIIIKSIIFMTKGLNMKVVAEGVETLEQLEFLKQQECSEIQGYLFSEAVEDEKFKLILKQKLMKPNNRFRIADQDERRYFYRISLLFPLSSNMTLTSFQGKNVNLGRTAVIIDNIGGGGLKFLSTMELPVRPDVVYQFETTIMNEEVTVKGFIVWKNELKDGFFEYGLQLLIDEIDRNNLLKLLNKFSVQLKANPLVLNTSFILEDRFSYLKKVTRNSL